jgi:hypothetical protein
VSRPEPLYQWAAEVASRFPKLSKAQAFVLALYSFGAVLARCCGLCACALMAAKLLGCKEDAARQRLREFYKDAQDKRGRKRKGLDVTTCFGPLLAWVTHDWPCRRLALALDPTTLGDRLTVLAVSVVYRGCATPVAWKVLAGNEPGAWNPHWQGLLGAVAASLGPGWEVVVLSDRGLESKDLFAAITALGWHPLMRVKAGGTFRPAGWHKFYPLRGFAADAGCPRRSLAGHAYKKESARLACTLLACWEPGHQDRWLILTDLPPWAADPCWYAFRAWIEQGFKVAKSAGWQWQRSRMADPARAERLWLVVALATLWVLRAGGHDEARAWGQVPDETLPPLPARGPLPAPGRAPRPRRLHRVFRRGLAVILAALAKGLPLPLGCFVPEPWPDPGPVQPITEEEFVQDHTYP